VALGPDQGSEYATAILAGGATLIGQLNTEEAAIGSLDRRIGQRATEIQYGQSITAGFLAGLKERRAEIAKEMKLLGDEIARELAKDFHTRGLDHHRRHHGGGGHGHHHQGGGHGEGHGWGHGAAPEITINFHGGTPNGEELARIKRELAMALGGG